MRHDPLARLRDIIARTDTRLHHLATLVRLDGSLPHLYFFTGPIIISPIGKQVNLSSEVIRAIYTARLETILLERKDGDHTGDQATWTDTAIYLHTNPEIGSGGTDVAQIFNYLLTMTIKYDSQAVSHFLRQQRPDSPANKTTLTTAQAILLDSLLRVLRERIVRQARYHHLAQSLPLSPYLVWQPMSRPLIQQMGVGSRE